MTHSCYLSHQPPFQPGYLFDDSLYLCSSSDLFVLHSISHNDSEHWIFCFSRNSSELFIWCRHKNKRLHTDWRFFSWIGTFVLNKSNLSKHCPAPGSFKVACVFGCLVIFSFRESDRCIFPSAQYVFVPLVITSILSWSICITSSWGAIPSYGIISVASPSLSDRTIS